MIHLSRPAGILELRTPEAFPSARRYLHAIVNHMKNRAGGYETPRHSQRSDRDAMAAFQEESHLIGLKLRMPRFRRMRCPFLHRKFMKPCAGQSEHPCASTGVGQMNPHNQATPVARACVAHRKPRPPSPGGRRSIVKMLKFVPGEFAVRTEHQMHTYAQIGSLHVQKTRRRSETLRRLRLLSTVNP